MECILRIKSVMLLLLLSITLSLSLQPTYAQSSGQQLLKINIKNGTFSELADQIRKQSSYTFFYNDAMVMNIKNITIQNKSLTLDNVLKIALKGQNLNYKIKDKTIIIFSKNATSGDKKVTLQGQVYDENGRGLAGTNVMIKNTLLGTMTDKDGNYSFCVPDVPGITVIFTYIGKVSKEVKYTGDPFINIKMAENDNNITEIQVTARQNINEIDVRSRTGVVSEVDVKRLNQKPMVNFAMALQGAIPGLIVSNKGDLGSKPEIRIRGTSSLRKGDAANEPLYVLDGQVISSEAFLTLNSNDIKEIKVLKDAVACAMYGIKAANGVLEITSNRGTSGDMVATYSFSGGLTLRGRRGVQMMNSREKLDLEFLMKNPIAPGYRYSEEYYRKYNSTDPNLSVLIADGKKKIDSLAAINTDWFNELLTNNFYQQHNLSVKGGTEKTMYYTSINYSQQGGRIPGNDVQRVTGRISMDQKIGNNALASISVNGGYALTNSPNGTTYSPTDLVYQLNPYEQKNSSTELISFPNRSYNDLFNQFSSRSTDKRIGFSGSFNWTIVKGLDLAAVAGIDMVLAESEQLTPPTAYSELKSGVEENQRGIFSKAKNTNTNTSTNVRLTYNGEFGLHNITVGANMDYYGDIIDNLSITGYGLNAKMQSAAGINQSIEGNRKPKVYSKNERTAQLGVGLLMGYTYNNIYDIFGTFKCDASSILPVDKRWNSAWAVGLGWDIKQYNFLKDSRAISSLKFRASYGCTASLQGVSPSATVGTFNYTQEFYGTDPIIRLQALYNSDLKPEQTISSDLGLSIGLWDNVTIELGAYKRRTKDALLDVPIPSSNGFSILKRNIGELENSGYEGNIFVKIIDNNMWRMSAKLNVAYNRNKVVNLYYADKLYTSETSLLPEFEVGKSYDMIYGPESLGINSMTGLPVFRGADGREIAATEKLSKEDMIALGHSTPPYSGSLAYSLSYGNFDLDMDFYFVLGGKKAYSFSYVRELDNINLNAVKGQTQNMWFHKGDENKIYHTPFYTQSAVDNLKLWPNTRTVGSSDYFRMSMLSLRYRLPYTTIEKMKGVIKFASIAFQASNLFVLTHYKESDPESGSLVGTQQPLFTLNLSVSF